MSCYVSQQLIWPGISSIFCNLHCRRNTLPSFKTVLYLHKLGIFLTLIRRVCRNQSPAESWMGLQGAASVHGVVLCGQPWLSPALPHTLVTLLWICLRRVEVTPSPWLCPRDTWGWRGHRGPWCVTPSSARPERGRGLWALLAELLKASRDFPYRNPTTHLHQQWNYTLGTWEYFILTLHAVLKTQRTYYLHIHNTSLQDIYTC